jgi:predicted CopG family antitoxin
VARRISKEKISKKTLFTTTVTFRRSLYRKLKRIQLQGEYRSFSAFLDEILGNFLSKKAGKNGSE